MTKKTLIPVNRKESEASQLLHFKAPDEAEPFAVIEVQPREQPHISLGSFTVKNPPKGFVLEITPEPEPEAVAAQITSLGAEYGEYELVLHVANYGDKAVNVEVTQL